MMGLATQSPICQHHLQSGTLLPNREPATAQAWLAAHPTITNIARDRDGGWRSCGKGPAAGGTGRGSVASNGERQSGLPRCRPQIDASDPQRDRGNDNRIQTAHRGRAPPVEGYLRHEETNATILGLSKRRNADQADRARDRP